MAVQENESGGIWGPNQFGDQFGDQLFSAIACRCPFWLPTGKPNASTASRNGPQTFDLYGFGAGNEVRTRDLNLGKVALYQLSYSRRNGVP